MKYRKKPVTVEAVQWTGENWKELIELENFSDVGLFGNNGDLAVKTLEGWLYASPGDYIIRGIRGEFYPCKPDIFEETYEPV